MRVGLIGLGVVGSATKRWLAGHQIIEYDPKHSADYPAGALQGCDLGIVCVDSPHVWQAMRSLPTDRVLIRSTLPPGETKRLQGSTGRQVGYWPCFIGESNGHPWTEESHVPFAVLGGSTDLWLLFDKLAEPFSDRRVIFCRPEEAELIKLADNSWLATKVAFANELHAICKTLGVDWDQVRQGWLSDPRVGESHAESRDGFGGKCLPRDLRILAGIDCPTPVLEAVRSWAR